MSERNQHSEGGRSPLAGLGRATGRRDFLKWTGAGALALVAVGCEDDPTRTIVEVTPPDTVQLQPPPPPGPASVTLDFSSPVAIANYAYALEQLEAAFYTRVTEDFFAGATDEEVSVLIDVRDHEIAHREFYEAKIQELGGNPITELTFDFSAVDFGSRSSVLETALMFENLGVWAYNGAARFIQKEPLLENAGDIVSVEARHAAAFSDILDLGFTVDALDQALVPSEVLPKIQPFIVNEINVMNLPEGA